MGIWETISDLVEAAAPWSVVEAEAPAKDDESKDDGDDKSDDADDKKEDGDDAEDDDEEEEEEDEEEIEDPKEKFEEECKESKECSPAKHHYDECVERVTAAQDSGDGSKEDCVEEFFHLAHCATKCAAPKLWSALK